MEMKRNGNIRASEEGTLSYMYISVERMKNNLNGRVAISDIFRFRRFAPIYSKTSLLAVLCES